MQLARSNEPSKASFHFDVSGMVVVEVAVHLALVESGCVVDGSTRLCDRQVWCDNAIDNAGSSMSHYTRAGSDVREIANCAIYCQASARVIFSKIVIRTLNRTFRMRLISRFKFMVRALPIRYRMRYSWESVTNRYVNMRIQHPQSVELPTWRTHTKCLSIVASLLSPIVYQVLLGAWNKRIRMSKIMASFQRVCPALQAEYGDEPIPVKRINGPVAQDSGCGVSSVCVSDHCYNWHNQGPSVKLSNPKFFIRVKSGWFKYVGPNYPYSGEIESKPQGCKEVIVVGRRINGQSV